MNHSLRLLLAASLLGVLSAAPVQAALVYTQGSDYPNGYNALTSQSQLSGGVYEAFDNFQVTGSGSVNIEAITFQGIYWNPQGPQFNPVALPSPQNLQVQIFANSGGLPGTLLGLSTLSFFHSVAIGTSYFGPDNTGQTDLVNVYNFQGNLTSPVSLSTNTEYWLSIASYASPTPPIWLWTSGTGGDGKSLQYQYSVKSYGSAARDRTFSLYNTPFTTILLGGEPPEVPPTGVPADVPEPGSLTLLALGLACGAAVQRRRRQKTAAV